jgi:GNAT superfamily N-acetyltransferase
VRGLPVVQRATTSGTSPGGNEDEQYQEYLRRQKTWGKKPSRDTSFTVTEVEHHLASGYIRLPVKIAGTKTVVASGQIRYADGKLEVSQVAVEGDYRGFGLTYLVLQGLMLYATRRLKLPPDTVVWLEASSQSLMDNETLVGIYQKCGFERKGGTSTGQPYMEGKLGEIGYACQAKVAQKNIRLV